MPVFVQPHLMDPENVATDITAENLRGFMMSGEPGAADPRIPVEVASDKPGAWVTENRTMDPDGGHVELCPRGPGPARRLPRRTRHGGSLLHRLADEGYQPAGPVPARLTLLGLQWLETGIVLAWRPGLTGFCFWRIRRDFT